MKGKLLSYEEVKNLKDGTKVWVEYDFKNGLFDKNVRSGLELVNDGKLWDYRNIPMKMKYVLDYLEKNTLQIYEYIEDEQTITKESTIKTYKGSEILAMIEDGRLHREDILILANTNTEFEAAKIIDGYYGCEVLLKNKFVVKKKTSRLYNRL